VADEKTLGRAISAARKAKQINQKELAAKICREDGESISPQYLNDIEHDRRSPSSEVIRQIAQQLDLDPDYLHLLVGKWPDDLPARHLSQKEVSALMVAFRKKVDR
jgi:transcriptional regulator with XRE-family HTH domain